MNRSHITREDRISFLKTDAPYPVVLDLIGYTYPDPCYEVKRLNFPYYIFEYVISGKGHLRIEDRFYTPEEGDVYIIPAYTEHEYGSDKKAPWYKVWFNAGGPLIESLLVCYGIQGIVLFRKVPPVLQTMFKEGVAELSENQADCLKTASVIFLKIIMELAIHHRNTLIKISPDGDRIRSLLRKNFQNPNFHIDDLAKALNYSRSQILRIFSRDFGKTPYQYLLDLRLELAKIQLTDRERRIKSIALTLGFTDPFYFSHIFKKKLGISPQKYRDEQLKKQAGPVIVSQESRNSDKYPPCGKTSRSSRNARASAENRIPAPQKQSE